MSASSAPIPLAENEAKTAAATQARAPLQNIPA